MKKDINSLLKNNKKEEVEKIFKNLTNYFDAKKCTIYVFITSGAGCDSPIISFKNKVYSFDTYGSNFKNWREWDRCFSYGMCGTNGTTSSLKCVANSCISFNRENGKVALITEEVYKKLKKEGYSVIKLKYGFN